MSHEVESFAYTGEKPWHGLGVRVGGSLTPKEMLVAAKLNWEVLKEPLTYKGPNGSDLPVKGHYAICRKSDGRLYAVVKSEAWEPVQNHAAIEIFDKFVKEGNMTMETAGSLFNGQIVFVLAKLAAGFTLSQSSDSVESYMLFTNPHRYGQAVSVRLTPVRVVCNNTLTWSLSMASEFDYRVPHNLRFNPSAVSDTIHRVHINLNRYKEQAELLSSKRYSEESLVEYINRVIPRKRPTDAQFGETSIERIDESLEQDLNEPLRGNALKVLEMVEDQPGHRYFPGTYWNAFNAVTHFVDHHVGEKEERRLYNAWYGGHRTLKNRALKLAVEFAKAA